MNAISDQEFELFREMLHRITGISLSPVKKALVCGRLSKRLGHHALSSYGDYFRLLNSAGGKQELQIALDLLTTNETYFFREPKHFDYLRDRVIPHVRPGRMFRVWSAACSTGEEPYSLAMMLAEYMGSRPWEIVASDISTRALEKARSGHYALERADHIPKQFLSRYCLRGTGKHEGTFLVSQEIRNHIQFMHLNLNATLPRLGQFDVIFLRNVMIYFNAVTKSQVVSRILPLLKPGGHFLVGHSETLSGIADGLTLVQASVYKNERT